MASTNPAPEMEFTLDQAGIPVYRQIIRQIEHGVLSGRLKTGDKLPTIRSLAVALKINPNTIAKAYGELETRGILTTQVGSGTYISGKKPENGETLDGKIQEALGRFLQEMRSLGLNKEETLRLIEDFQENEKQ